MDRVLAGKMQPTLGAWTKATEFDRTVTSSNLEIGKRLSLKARDVIRKQTDEICLVGGNEKCVLAYGFISPRRSALWVPAGKCYLTFPYQKRIESVLKRI